LRWRSRYPVRTSLGETGLRGGDQREFAEIVFEIAIVVNGVTSPVRVEFVAWSTNEALPSGGLCIRYMFHPLWAGHNVR